MANLSIRPARSADTDAIGRCVIAAYSPYVELMDRTPAPMLDDYRDLIDRDAVWVAIAGPELLGAIVMWAEADHFYIDNIAVDPAGQGRGVGGTLLAVADREAVAAGFDEIRLYTNEIMTDNVGFYRKRGYVETHRATDRGYRRIFFSRRLTPTS